MAVAVAVGDVKLSGEDLRRLKVGVDDPRRKGLTQDWLSEYTKRMTVVEVCKRCGKGLIAEEVDAHYLSHLSSAARRVAARLLVAAPEVRDEVKAYLATVK